MKRDCIFLIAAVTLLTGCLLENTDALAVMSVDLGSEYMKIAIVKPGVPMEIALNRESQRKTPVVVSMRNGERTIGDPALTSAVKFPKLAYWYLQDLIGKDYDNPQVEAYRRRFPYYDMEKDPETGLVVFKHDENNKYSVEELMAMILEKARETAANFAEQPINEAVITVPAFFNQAERRAMMRAADMAGIKVLQLMNDNSAVALNYGVFRRKDFNTTATHYMFVDVGASSMTATVLGYQVVKVKNPVTGIAESNPQISVKGVGFDGSLGGLEFQLRIRDHLARAFNTQAKTKTDVFSNHRSMAKLFKEAGRAKRVLSANTEYMAQVEGLLEDIDFKHKIVRAEFEEMCMDLFERVAKPIKDAMALSQVTWDEISEVILMGGGTRIPKIQEKIMEVTGRTQLGKSINSDEAGAMGAVYQAAHLSKGFKVKNFPIKDANLYPIQVEFERIKSGEDGTETSRTVKRTLFGLMNPFPQKKVMTFNKHMKDFGFEVNYGDLTHLTEQQLKIFGSNKLQVVNLSGVEAALQKQAEDAEAKGVKAHFKMDESGILLLDKVESVFERLAPPEEEEESTLSKLGSFFFGAGDKEKGEKKEGEAPEAEEQAAEGKPGDEKNAKDEKKAKEEKTEDKKSEESKEQETPKEEEKKEEKKEEKADEKKEEPKPKEEEKQEETSEKKEEGGKDKTKTDEKDEKKEEEPKEKKPKQLIIKEEIAMETSHVDIKDPSVEALTASKKKIAELRRQDEEKFALEKAKNDLESFIIDGQDKLYQQNYKKCSTKEEREELQALFSTASDWLYEQEEDAKIKVFTDKRKELVKATKALYERVKELEDRPRAMEAFNTLMNYSSHFLIGMKNFTGEVAGEQPFTQVEYSTLEKLLTDTKAWNKTQHQEQAKTPLTEKPVLTVEEIAKKMSELDREVKYLINKAKIFKPKPKPEEKKENKTESTGENKKNETKKRRPKQKRTPEEQEATKKEKETQEEKLQLDDKESKKEAPEVPVEEVPTPDTSDTPQEHNHEPDDEL